MQVLLAAADEPWETVVVRALQQPASGMTLVRRCIDVADAVATAASGRADAVLLSARLSGLDVDVLQRLVDAGAEPVVVTDPDDEPTASRVARMGTASVLCWRDIGELPRLVAQRASARHNGGAAPAAVVEQGDETFSTVADDGPLGRLVAVWGPTGAPGRSTVSVGLAAACAQRGLPTLLVDADVYGGAVSSMLAMLDEVSGLLAAARQANTGSLDLPALHNHVREIGPCLRVLTGLPRADRWPQLRPGALTQVLHVARQMAPLVVVDCGFSLEQDEELSFDTAAPRRNGATVTTLERADMVVAVGSADPLGLTRLARGLLDLRETVPGVDVAIVVNRTRSSLGWSRSDVADLLRRFTGSEPVGYLPEDRAAVDRALVKGRTLVESAPASALATALDELAGQVAELPAASRRPRGLLRRKA